MGELKEKLGLTLIFIAHDLSMVRYVSDHMAVMYLGTIVEVGKADDVYFKPKHPYTEILVGSNPEPDPNVEEGELLQLFEVRFLTCKCTGRMSFC